MILMDHKLISARHADISTKDLRQFNWAPFGENCFFYRHAMAYNTLAVCKSLNALPNPLWTENRGKKKHRIKNALCSTQLGNLRNEELCRLAEQK